MFVLSGYCYAEWFWYSGECTGQACEAIFTTDLWYHSLEIEQQVSQSQTTGCWSHLQNCSGHDDLWGGEYPTLTYTVGITFHKWPPSISDHFINLTNRPQFSIVYTLIDHRNDIIKCSKLKWNHLPGSLQSFECFMASFLWSIRV